MGETPVSVLRRALGLGGVCVGLLAAVYLLAVWTVPGQRFEDAVLGAADSTAGGAERATALSILDAITIPSVVAAVILIMLISISRRRLFLGFLSIGTVVGSIATSEVFQRFLQRPVLLAHGLRREDQSFPSGHTTVAISLMCALVMVTPYRCRGLVVFVSSLWAAGVGVATVTASWHRPSDTIGADLIVITYACSAVALSARWGRVREAAPLTSVGRALRAVLAGVYAAVAVLTFAVAAGIVVSVLTAFVHGGTGTAMLVAGRALALSGCAAAAVAMLALLRRVDLGAPAANLGGEGKSNGESGNARLDRPSGS